MKSFIITSIVILLTTSTVVSADGCCTRSPNQPVCPDGMVEMADVEAICCPSPDDDIGIVMPCSMSGGGDVSITSTEGGDQGEDDQGGDDTETTTTTSGADATDCCTTTDSTCPSGKTNVDADTMVSGVMVETCCASDGDLDIKTMNLSSLDPCVESTADPDQTGDNSAPAERVAIAIGMVLVGATMLQ